MALAALALVVFGAYDSYPTNQSKPRDSTGDGPFIRDPGHSGREGEFDQHISAYFVDISICAYIHRLPT